MLGFVDRDVADITGRLTWTCLPGGKDGGHIWPSLLLPPWPVSLWAVPHPEARLPVASHGHEAGCQSFLYVKVANAPLTPQAL